MTTALTNLIEAERKAEVLFQEIENRNIVTVGKT